MKIMVQTDFYLKEKLPHKTNTTVQDVIKYIDCWIKYHNSKPCPNDSSKTIQEMLNGIEKQDIDKNILNDLMMKTETRTINKHGITFLGLHYRREVLLDLRESVFIRYSLFDLSKIYVYSMKGEFLCVDRQEEKIHPMANYLGTVRDMEEFKQRIQKQKRQFNKAKKEFLKYYPTEDAEVLEIEREPVVEIAQISEDKPKHEHKQTPREQQMNRPIFANDAEKYEWLIAHGCTNQEDRRFLTKFIQSEQYQLLYGD